MGDIVGTSAVTDMNERRGSRVQSLLSWMLILAAALLLVLRMVWLSEETDHNDAIADTIFLGPLDREFLKIVATTMIIAGAGLCGYSASTCYKWVGSLLAIVLTWCLWAALAMATQAFIAQLKLNPDVWGWWVTFSPLEPEGGIAWGAALAANLILAFIAAMHVIRFVTRTLDGRRYKAAD